MKKENRKTALGTTRRIILKKEYLNILSCISSIVRHIANNPEPFLMVVTALFWDTFSMKEYVAIYFQNYDMSQYAHHQILLKTLLFVKQNANICRGFMLGLGCGAIGLYIIPPDGDKMKWYLFFSMICTFFLLFIRLPLAIILGVKLQAFLIIFCLFSGYVVRRRWVNYLKEY